MSRRPEPKFTKHPYKGFKILGSHYTDPPKYGKKRTYLILKDDEYVFSPEIIIPKLKDAKGMVDEIIENSGE